MITIIPSINVLTFAEVQERIKQIEPFVSWCHLDVTDGIFSAHPTWRNPDNLSLLTTSLNVEVHLMVGDPEKHIDQWLVKPVKRLIVHLEASRDIDAIIDRCHVAGIECGLAIRPETLWSVLMPWAKKVDMIQILAVNPGPSGQQAGPDIIDKIRRLRTWCRECMIEIDGGINREIAAHAREAGANILVSSAYIFSHTDIGAAIKELKGQ